MTSFSGLIWLTINRFDQHLWHQVNYYHRVKTNQIIVEKNKFYDQL